jgi:hypothetical protein
MERFFIGLFLFSVSEMTKKLAFFTALANAKNVAYLPLRRKSVQSLKVKKPVEMSKSLKSFKTLMKI